MSTTTTIHFGLPVIEAKAWAFDSSMIYEAWGAYVKAHPDKFDTNFLMTCTSLPPQAQEAIEISRETQGDMNPTVLKYIENNSQLEAFVRAAESCPNDCICPGAFREVFVEGLSSQVRDSLLGAAAEMKKTMGKTVYFVPIELMP